MADHYAQIAQQIIGSLMRSLAEAHAELDRRAAEIERLRAEQREPRA